jgi:RimJ/RimL family protein N-acetyltransferase/putative methionine-R-sulfoxide reductase with GAF domain
MAPTDPLSLTLAAVLREPHDRVACARRIAEAIRSDGAYRWVGLYDVDHGRGEVRNLAWAGPGAPAYPTFSIGQGLTSTAIADRATVNVGDVTTRTDYLTALSSTRSEIIIPIVTDGGEVVGTLDIESERANAFPAGVQQRLEQVAIDLRPLWGPEVLLPLGPHVGGGAARWPARTTLDGRWSRLVPLDVAMHCDDLYERTHGPANEHVWRYLGDGPFATRDDFREALTRKATAIDAVFFAILDQSSAPALGYASYMRIEPAHRVIEVGNVLFGPGLQRTTAATEAMYLMARYAFEDLGYRRYEWKCNALNARSRAAALRLGFTFEGVFRQHMILKERSRDTAWFSMLDSEWPARKAAFERWLDPANFDDDGRQRARLSSGRA